MAGKGSKPRPISIPKEKFDENWDAIFKSCLEKKKVNNESSGSDSNDRIIDSEEMYSKRSNPNV